MNDFPAFSKLVTAKYDAMRVNRLFTVSNKGLYAAYLAAFPEGTNPIYKERTEHDCQCCANFINNLGRVVSIKNGQLESVWDVEGAPYPYDVVAKAMSQYVRSQTVEGLFCTDQTIYGKEFNHQQLPDGSVKRWNHFNGLVSKRDVSTTPDAVKGNYRAFKDVLYRGLTTLTMDALVTVHELITNNNLYRGEEHLGAVEAFISLLKDSETLGIDLFSWQHASNQAAGFRNTVIGSLVRDISEGKPVEEAVKAFEAKVAPANYKRPKALVTQSMVKAAMATIAAEGLERATARRFARLSDVSVNNVLWVNNDTKSKMKSDIEGLLLKAVKPSAKKVPAEELTIAEFMQDVLPQAQTLEILVENKHQSNFVSLTAPVHADAPLLFKWDNGFAWSYKGDTADSIKERVKAAGGNVTNAKLRVSLAWFNYDDLDIHVMEPNGNHIYFRNKSNKLDVDMNAGFGHTRTAVENVSWVDVRDGTYSVVVDNYFRRETGNVGCVIEIENNGQIVQLSHSQEVGKNTPIVDLAVKNGVIVQMDVAKNVTGGGVSQDVWGVKTEMFIPVSTLMYSPNHWDGNATGNKHYIFMLEGCKNPETTRGIYNEFLRADLAKHGRVMEVLGNRTHCPITDEQLSGVGFSSTRKDIVVVKVTTDSKVKTFKINF